MKYLVHLFTSHGLPPEIVVDMIANKIYKKEEDKEKMRGLYNFLET